MPRLDFRCAVQRALALARSRARERASLLSSSFLAFFFSLLHPFFSFAQKARSPDRLYNGE